MLNKERSIRFLFVLFFCSVNSSSLASTELTSLFLALIFLNLSFILALSFS